MTETQDEQKVVSILRLKLSDDPQLFKELHKIANELRNGKRDAMRSWYMWMYSTFSAEIEAQLSSLKTNHKPKINKRASTSVADLTNLGITTLAGATQSLAKSTATFKGTDFRSAITANLTAMMETNKANQSSPFIKDCPPLAQPRSSRLFKLVETANDIQAIQRAIASHQNNELCEALCIAAQALLCINNSDEAFKVIMVAHDLEKSIYDATKAPYIEVVQKENKQRKQHKELPIKLKCIRFAFIGHKIKNRIEGRINSSTFPWDLEKFALEKPLGPKGKPIPIAQLASNWTYHRWKLVSENAGKDECDPSKMMRLTACFSRSIAKHTTNMRSALYDGATNDLVAHELYAKLPSNHVGCIAPYQPKWKAILANDVALPTFRRTTIKLKKPVIDLSQVNDESVRTGQTIINLNLLTTGITPITIDLGGQGKGNRSRFRDILVQIAKDQSHCGSDLVYKEEEDEWYLNLAFASTVEKAHGDGTLIVRPMPNRAWMAIPRSRASKNQFIFECELPTDKVWAVGNAQVYLKKCDNKHQDGAERRVATRATNVRPGRGLKKRHRMLKIGENRRLNWEIGLHRKCAIDIVTQAKRAGCSHIVLMKPKDDLKRPSSFKDFPHLSSSDFRGRFSWTAAYINIESALKRSGFTVEIKDMSSDEYGLYCEKYHHDRPLGTSRQITARGHQQANGTAVKAPESHTKSTEQQGTAQQPAPIAAP